MLFGIALAVVVLAAGAIWYTNAHQGPMGQEFDVMAANHVAEGSDPGPYNSNPPTSGRHYASEYDAGFYRPGDPATLAPYPAGYLVHNLEHGYVIFWYNCEALDSSADCTALKDAIAAVMDQADNWKMIAFPWTSIDTPVVLTTWGRLLAMDEFDADLAMDFVRRNRNQAPEPNAP
jgi:hypothetical protein